MKKANKNRLKILQRKREKRNFKRKDVKFMGSFFTDSDYSALKKWKIKSDEKIIEKTVFEIDEFLNKNESSKFSPTPKPIVEIPKDFRIEHNQSIVFQKIKEIRLSIISFDIDELVIDFRKCSRVDFASLFLLRTVLDEYLDHLSRVGKRLSTLNVETQVLIRNSKNQEVQAKLLACEIIKSASINEANLLPVSAMKFFKGTKSQSKYSENKKGSIATKIRKYIDGCLKQYSTKLSPTEQRKIDGIISEILNNAEDHSDFNTWYSFGNFFRHSSQNEEFVGEINLAFMNFGKSIYEGLLDTSKDNKDQFEWLEKIHDKVKESDKRNIFTSENIYTLNALQDGVSRLKFESQSRGTGTMTFINSFLGIGDYQCDKRKLFPKLLIFSGNTMLKCDNQYKPFEKNGRFWLSLNEKLDITQIPSNSHLRTINHKFPGTLIAIKLYISRDHLHRKIKNDREHNRSSSI